MTKMMGRRTFLRSLHLSIGLLAGCGNAASSANDDVSARRSYALAWVRLARHSTCRRTACRWLEHLRTASSRAADLD
jgi:hypothetical protein